MTFSGEYCEVYNPQLYIHCDTEISAQARIRAHS